MKCKVAGRGSGACVLKLSEQMTLEKMRGELVDFAHLLPSNSSLSKVGLCDCLDESGGIDATIPTNSEDIACFVCCFDSYLSKS